MKAGDITELESLRDWMEPGSVRRAVLNRVLALIPEHEKLKEKFRKACAKINAHDCTCSGCSADEKWASENS